MLSAMRFIGESGAEWDYDGTSRLGDKSGFGEVFEGTDQAGNAVAVKRVRLLWGDEAERRRREREVEIGEVINASTSTYLVRTLDVGRVGDDLLIVMPRAEKSLRSGITVGLSEAEGFETLRHIVAGLIEMATLSILYRDLKPENVLWLDNRWQLADFGIARDLVQATATYTFLGAGTTPYMAPEIWNNQPATIQSDLYALGVVAYEVLLGTRPFSGDEAALRDQHLHAVPPTPTGLPPAVARLMVRLLSKDPADRPQDARAVSESLESALKTLNSGQRALQEAALEAQRRRASAEADHAAGVSAARAGESQARQALSDLEEILAQAFDLVHEALPDAKFHGDGAQWHLIWGDARVSVVPWRRRASDLSFEDDPLVAAGAVFLGPGLAKPAANVACMDVDGRLLWEMLRFRANAFVGPNYSFGPMDRPHGFDESLFRQERSYMVRPITHVWGLTRSDLTPESVVDLLNESIAES
jgi:hypothetical protein